MTGWLIWKKAKKFNLNLNGDSVYTFLDMGDPVHIIQDNIAKDSFIKNMYKWYLMSYEAVFVFCSGLL